MAQDARDALEDALDDMSDEGQLFIGKYAVRSSMEVSRPGGGQGLVQFARDQAHNTEVAIKVYLVERLPSAGIFVFRTAAALAYLACRNQYRCTTAFAVLNTGVLQESLSAMLHALHAVRLHGS